MHSRPMIYAHSHLPGAINIPRPQVDATRLAKRIPDSHGDRRLLREPGNCDDLFRRTRYEHSIGQSSRDQRQATGTTRRLIVRVIGVRLRDVAAASPLVCRRDRVAPRVVTTESSQSGFAQ